MKIFDTDLKQKDSSRTKTNTFRFYTSDWRSMVHRTTGATKSTLDVSSSFGQKKAAISQMLLEGPLERETFNDVSSIEMLSLNEAALDLGKQSVCLQELVSPK